MSQLPNEFNVCFVPFDTRNPYQRELAAHLQSLEVEVVPRDAVKGLVWQIVRGAPVPPLIHLHWLPPCRPGVRGRLRTLAFVWRLLTLRFLGRRFVWTVHNLCSHESASPAAERWLARRVVGLAAGVIVHSPRARRLVEDEIGRDCGSKLQVVPHGNYVGAYRNALTRDEARDRLRLRPDNLVLLFFGNIRPYKGVPELIAAYRRLESSGTTLLIVGRPLNEQIAEDLERAAAGDDRIRVRCGFVEDDEVQLFMNASDLVVFPYQDLLSSGAVLLAMSFGRPCVAPAIGCIPDLLDDRGAFLYDPHEPDALLKALARAVASQGRLAAMGAYNLERAREWDWGSVARQTASVYRRALERPPIRTQGDSQVETT